VQVLAARPVGAAFGEHGARLLHRSLSSVPAVLMLSHFAHFRAPRSSYSDPGTVRQYFQDRARQDGKQ
jgi:hypothetical protein